MSTTATTTATPKDNASKRDAILKKIEDGLKMKVIAYLTGDRPGLETQIGGDVIVRFRRHLEAIGDIGALGLFLYTRGGDTNVPWRLVTLLREYCKKLVVLVPFRAHSSGTLICMGADEIVLGRMAELTSIDPSVANQFNPPDPLNPMTRVPISVEDVNAYKNLARRFDIEKENPRNAEVFLALASKVDPLALGNVERTHNQIRKLAKDLLLLHPPELAENADKIVEMLTVGLYSHAHLINRKEAGKIGLNVKEATKEVDALLWDLFAEYSSEMELDTPFTPHQILTPEKPVLHVTAKRAFVESVGKTDTFISDGTVSRIQPGALQLPPGMQLPPQLLQAQIQVQVRFDFEGWKITR